MAIALVSGQEVTNSGTPWSASASATATLASDLTVGNTVFVMIGIGANETIVSVTDDGAGGSNTYVTDAGLTALNATSGTELWIYWAPVERAANVITVEFDSTNGGEGYIVVREFSGLNNADLLEDTNTASYTTNTTALNGGAVTTTVNDSLIVANWYGTNGSYTNDAEYSGALINGSVVDGFTAYKILTATAASEEWNLTAGGAGETGSSVTGAFNGAAAGGARRSNLSTLGVH